MTGGIMLVGHDDDHDHHNHDHHHHNDKCTHNPQGKVQNRKKKTNNFSFGWPGVCQPPKTKNSFQFDTRWWVRLNFLNLFQYPYDDLDHNDDKG